MFRLRLGGVAVLTAAVVSAASAASAPTTAPGLVVFAHATAPHRPADLVVMNPNGSGRRRLTTSAQDDSQPSWSPDRRRIAFHRCCVDGASVIMLITVATEHTERLRGSVEGCEPAWSPDGRRIAYTLCGPGEIRISTLDGKVLAHWPGHAPAWSPDSRRVAYLARGEFGNQQIWLRNADGRSRLRVTSNGPRDELAGEPTWSPDGKLIAFAGRRGHEGPARIYAIRPDGAGLHELGNRAAVREPLLEPVWSPDSQSLAVTSYVKLNLQLFALRTSDGAIRRVTHDAGDDRAPDWR